MERIKNPQNALDKFTEERHKLLKMSEISLWLDTYDDIFSDFDPRPYSQRALSDDFLYEAKKYAKEKKAGIIELKLLIPKDKRNNANEATIRKRLKEYFKNQEVRLGANVAKLMQRSILMVLAGIAFMVGAAAVIFTYPENSSFLIVFLIVILEPAGWFFFWEGLNHALFENKEKIAELEFYKKMSNCDVQFIAY
jgi:hypothetical protein